MSPFPTDQITVTAEPFLAQLGIGVIDADVASGRIHLDEAASHLFGADPSWMVGGVTFSRFLEQVYVDDRDCVRECLGMIDAASPSFITEHRTYPDPGRISWVLVRGRGYFDESGILLRIVGIVIDVTALKADERSYNSALPGGQSLNDLADLVIAARHLIDHLTLDDMRPLIDDLLVKVGLRLGRQIRSQARSALQ